jgi:hypothetical protein
VRNSISAVYMIALLRDGPRTAVSEQISLSQEIKFLSIFGYEIPLEISISSLEITCLTVTMYVR